MGTIMSDGYDRQMWKTFPRGIYDGPFGRNNNMFQVGLSINYVEGAFYAGCTNNVERERQAEYLICPKNVKQTQLVRPRRTQGFPRLLFYIRQAANGPKSPTQHYTQPSGYLT